MRSGPLLNEDVGYCNAIWRIQANPIPLFEPVTAAMRVYEVIDCEEEWVRKSEDRVQYEL